MNSTATFGDSVIAEAEKLRASGLDVNQIAGALCKKDPLGQNYGIGILLGRDGKPLPSSLTLLEYIEKELRESGAGNYLNSAALQNEVLEAVLQWQGVPEAHWPHFQILLPSDAGTGAVQTGIQAALLVSDKISTLAIEELGWPAYKAIAASLRLRVQEYKTDGIAQGEGILPLYQAGPMNTTGRVPSLEIVKARAASAQSAGVPVVLDRAYSGFEYARRMLTDVRRATSDAWTDHPQQSVPVGSASEGCGDVGRRTSDGLYAEIMKESFRTQILPFMEAGVPFAAAISPTKAFVTFSLRPCGILLIFHPDKAKAQALSPKLSGLIRARGSSFEHPVTRAFVKALVKDRARLEHEHVGALQRCAEAELAWQTHVKGTAIEPLFTDAYAGLFRNPLARPDAAKELYGAHLYPVFAEGRCRLNVTGLPADPKQASSHATYFAKYCYL